MRKASPLTAWHHPPEGEPNVDSGRPAVALVNLPNCLSGMRLVGAFVVVGLVLVLPEPPLLPVILLLLATDWLDGKLAMLWRQQTTFGARLDSLADITFYLAVLFALGWTHTAQVVAELPMALVAIGFYLINAAAGWYRFGQFPSYHTRGAKIAWFLSGLAIVGILSLDQGWPLRWAAGWVVLVNLEALLITWMLPAAAVDVSSLWRAWTMRRQLARTAPTERGTAAG